MSDGEGEGCRCACHYTGAPPDLMTYAEHRCHCDCHWGAARGGYDAEAFDQIVSWAYAVDYGVSTDPVDIAIADWWQPMSARQERLL